MVDGWVYITRDAGLIKQITDKIEYITCGENPISSDVIFIKGEKSTWIFDVGANDEAFNAIMEAINNVTSDRKVNIVISHFHRDHMGNIQRIIDINSAMENVNLYVSRYTYKHCNHGIIVDSDLTVEDGSRFRIFPIESSHSKGCLCLEVDDELVLLGDAIYPAYKTFEDDDSKNMSVSYDKFDTRNEYKKQHKVYNVQHLKQQIDKLKEVSARKVFLAHEKNPLVRTEIIIIFLERIYKNRVSDNPYIIQ